VLDHDDAVAAIDESLENGEETFDVVAVETGGGFVEEEKSAGGIFDFRFLIFDF